MNLFNLKLATGNDRARSKFKTKVQRNSRDINPVAMQIATEITVTYIKLILNVFFLRNDSAISEKNQTVKDDGAAISMKLTTNLNSNCL